MMASAAVALSPEALAEGHRLVTSFPHFARVCLRIRTKSGAVVPFEMNRAQRYLHDRLEKQRRERGKVRAIILKGRQLGASTYIQGRYYHRLWGGQGLKAFILTHEQPATDNLFGMAQRFQENIPDAFRPPTKAANAKELMFAHNDCGYAVATAGSKGVGRSSTIQMLHGSESAFWPNAEEHIDGLFQALADKPGTESIIESTANGIGNVYQRMWAAATRDESDYEPIFIPWFWGEDYERPCPSDWEPSHDWTEYGEAHDLSWPQLYWAFCRNRDMAAAVSEPDDKPCWKFRQEFCATAEEAFVTGGNSFIPAVAVAKARKAKVIGIGPIIIGVDPARGGGDKTGVIDRCGRRLGERICERWDEGDLMSLVGRIVGLIKRLRPDMVNIDVGGLGAGVYDRLVELGYGDTVNAVNFGARPLGIGPTGDELYANRRAEMWDCARSWFGSEGGVQIPDDDAVHADLTSPIWGAGATRHTSNNELVLEPKDKIRERLGFSPDLGDAAVLTFAVPYAPGMMAAATHQSAPRGRNAVTGY